jgi:hypothetical protein
MATTIESPIKEKDSYYVLRHKATGLYVNEHDLVVGDYDLEQTSLIDNIEFRGGYAPFRIYPVVEVSAMSVLEPAPGTDSDAVARLVNQEARNVVDWLNQNDHFLDCDCSKHDYEYSDFELMLVEVEYSVISTQPVAANA